MSIWKFIRLFVLLFIFVAVLGDMLLSKYRSTNWDNTLRVVIYPINGDASEHSDEYIKSLSRQTFDDIGRFMADEAKQYQIDLASPMEVDLSTPVKVKPPRPPLNRNDVVGVMWWSLKMRWWAFRNNNYDGPNPDIRVFVLYYDPDENRVLAHSLGLEKGLIGVVNAFADESYNGSNAVVIMHEIMHTLGATDKYQSNDEPSFPDGYGDPEQQPRYPQKYAEIMAGRIALTPNQSKMAEGLYEVVVGEKTAQEINWVEDE